MFIIENEKISYKEKNQEIAYLLFEQIGEKEVSITYTYVDPKYRGQKISDRLLQYAFSYFEEKKYHVVYACSYAKHWARKQEALSPENFNLFYEQVQALLYTCGQELKKREEQKKSSLKKDGSIVTNYDLFLDKKIKEGLQKIYDCPIFSEEHQETFDDTYFVVDPIDGTENFACDLDLFCTMIAFVFKGETKFSFIYLPLQNKMYTAKKGEGAYKNQKKLKVKGLQKRMIGNCNFTQDSMNLINKLREKYEVSVRSLGSCGIELAYVAEGIFDFYFSTFVGGPWDFIGGKLLVEEAGGRMETFLLKDGHYALISGTPEIFPEIKKLYMENVNQPF